MSEPVHAAIRDGMVIDTVVMDVATAELFRSLGFVEMVWPGAVLIDVTDLDPAVGIEWTYDGQSFSPPPPPPEPEPEPQPQPEPQPEPEPEPEPTE